MTSFRDTPLGLAGPLLDQTAELLGRLLHVTAERAAIIESPADLEGAPASRLGVLLEIQQLLMSDLQDEALVSLWLRTRNPELHGERPLAWLTGPGRMLDQMAMRLRRDHQDRRGGAI
jgi:hypothetical protein